MKETLFLIFNENWMIYYNGSLSPLQASYFQRIVPFVASRLGPTRNTITYFMKRNWHSFGTYDFQHHELTVRNDLLSSTFIYSLIHELAHEKQDRDGRLAFDDYCLIGNRMIIWEGEYVDRWGNWQPWEDDANKVTIGLLEKLSKTGIIEDLRIDEMHSIYEHLMAFNKVPDEFSTLFHYEEPLYIKPITVKTDRPFDDMLIDRWATKISKETEASIRSIWKSVNYTSD